MTDPPAALRAPRGPSDDARCQLSVERRQLLMKVTLVGAPDAKRCRADIQRVYLTT